MTALPQFVILIVEDDKSQVSLFRDEVNDFNQRKSICTFYVEVAENVEEAQKQFKSKFIDCAIVDLRLPSNADQDQNPTPENGNTLLNKIINDFAIPLAVVTGVPEEYDPPVNSNIKIYPREGEAYQKALEWFAQLNQLMLLLRDAQNDIKQETAKLFHYSIWPRWQSNLDIQSRYEKAKTAITRQIVCHLFEYLNIAKGSPTYFFPNEFYLKPPLRNRLHTGDLLCLEKIIWIIMTPQCNMANDSYPDSILVARCDEISEWKNITEEKRNGSSKNKGTATNKIRKLVNQHEISFHFLPPCDDLGPWKVNFKCIQTLPSSKSVDELLKVRIASLAPQFIPHLIQRFAGYMGRIGQPDLDQDELCNCLQTTLDPPSAN